MNDDRFRLFQFDYHDLVAMMGGRLRFDPAVLPLDATIVRFYVCDDYNPPILYVVIRSESFPIVCRGHPVPRAAAGPRVSDGGDPPTITVTPDPAGNGTSPWLFYPETIAEMRP